MESAPRPRNLEKELEFAKEELLVRKKQLSRNPDSLALREDVRAQAEKLASLEVRQENRIDTAA
jgi:hypothetical protein